MTPEEKELLARVKALENRLKQIDVELELLEHARAKTIMNMLDGPIMMFGKHDIDPSTINKKDNPKLSAHGADETPPFIKTRKKKKK